jgi:hypothetical protein
VNQTRIATILKESDRIESLKAGTCGALAAAITFSALLVTNSSILAVGFELLRELRVDNLALTEAIGLAIAAISGFLFGVTYRYIVRGDRNPHLQSGAVLAFGLVRGLAQVDAGLHTQANLWLLGVAALESILLFAIARLALDLAIGRGWVKVFQSNLNSSNAE